MTTNTIEGYIRWITLVPGDPTYSLLKAHLLFEELLRAYLAKTLPHSGALDGARLTFTQLLAVAKASSLHLQPDHWTWKAIADLNKLRNMLSHEARPSALAERMNDYVKFVDENIKVPLPEPAVHGSNVEANRHPQYTVVDLVTLGLYYYVAGSWGFDVDAIARSNSENTSALAQAVHKSGDSEGAG